MKHYLIIDTMNMLSRARHSTNADIFTKIGLSLHITLNCVRQSWNKFDSTHVVFCQEGKYNWRKDFYKKYKANRKLKKSKQTQQELDEDSLFYEMTNDFEEFLTKSTNCTVLQNDCVEADDFVARWIQKNNTSLVDKANNRFTIVSSDSDFQQLIDTNVQIYDGMSERLLTHKGIFEKNGEPVKDKKTGENLPIPNPDYILFKKCIRGDTSDNIEPAYPGIREKGSKKKIGIMQAFEDKDNKGYDWNNFMMQSFIDHYGNSKLVREQYTVNKKLIDLTKQPEDIIEAIDKDIDEALNNPKNIKMLGLHFLRFCGKYELENISKYSNSYLEFLKAGIN